jgi:nucleoid-associated protein EbfC
MGPGGFDMQQIFAAAQQALSAQQELANSEVTGTAGGGAVRAVVSGVGQLLDLTIDPSAIDPADLAESASTIADLVLAAVRDAWDSAVDLQQRQLGALGGSMGGMGGFGGPPAGFDLSSLGLPSFGQPGIAYDEDDEDLDDDEDDDDDEDLDDDEDDVADEDRPAGAPQDEPNRFRDLD